MINHKKTPGVFIKTCHKDHELLVRCLESIKRYLVGFEGLCIVTDENHSNIQTVKNIVNSMPVTIHQLPVPELDHTCQDGIGHLWMQNIKLIWNKFCDFDSVLQIDSDCIIDNIISPKFYSINNKWKWFVRPWDYAELAVVHKDPSRKLIKIDTKYEHMPLPGWILDRQTTDNFHRWLGSVHDCTWWEYLLEKTRCDWGNDIILGKSRGSSVYNAYGGFLEFIESPIYEFIDVIETKWQNLPPIK